MKNAFFCALLSLTAMPAFAAGFCGHEAGGYALEFFKGNEGRGLAEPFMVAPVLVGSPNRGDRAELWKISVAKFENGQRLASANYLVKVDSVSCGLLTMFPVEK